MARTWVDRGARYLHLVDLDGAREGKLVNSDIIQRIVAGTKIPCELGGGIRTQKDVDEVLSWGVERVIIGTQALKNPAWFEGICQRFPGKIVLGIDAKGGLVATDGWLQKTGLPALEVARRYEGWPLAALIYTDIDRDGTLEGANYSAIEEIADAVRLPVIASGGVTTLEEIRQLTRLKLAGCIIGRALYEGRLDLAEVIRVASSTG
jgi:phosphoribosylformimino-5-aminoimidazole carboxamide ribotide isomerase